MFDNIRVRHTINMSGNILILLSSVDTGIEYRHIPSRGFSAMYTNFIED